MPSNWPDLALALALAFVAAYIIANLAARVVRSMLHAILPDRIAAQLKEAPGTIADDVPSASVLFADVVDFTPMSAGMPPAELVELLDELFSVFDGFVTELGLEKIKTVGDAYMVAAGVPEARSDHAASECSYRRRGPHQKTDAGIHPSKQAVRQLLQYTTSNFHPNDRDTTELIAQWRASLFGSDGQLTELLAS